MVEVLFIIAILIFFAVWAYCKTDAIDADVGTPSVPDDVSALDATEAAARILRNSPVEKITKRKPRKRKKRQ